MYSLLFIKNSYVSINNVKYTITFYIYYKSFIDCFLIGPSHKS